MRQREYGSKGSKGEAPRAARAPHGPQAWLRAAERKDERAGEKSKSVLHVPWPGSP